MRFILTGLTLDINGIPPVSFRESQESVDGFDVSYAVLHISSQKEKSREQLRLHGQNCSRLRFTDRQTDFSQASLSVSPYVSLYVSGNTVLGKAGTLYGHTDRGVRRICISGTL